MRIDSESRVGFTHPTVASLAVVCLLPAFLQAQAGSTSKAESVVKVSAKVRPEAPGANGKQVVTINLDIADGWHVYANPPGQEDFLSVQTTVELSSAKPLRMVKVEYPKGTTVNDPVVGKYIVYKDKVAIKATVQRAAGDTGGLYITLKFQPCNDKQCLLPATKKLTVP